MGLSGRAWSVCSLAGATTACLLLALVWVFIAGHDSALAFRPRLPGVPRLRPVRVLIASRTREIRIRADGTLSVINADGGAIEALDGSEWLTVSADGSGRLRYGSTTSGFSRLEFRTDADGAVEVSYERKSGWSVERRYPGTIHIGVVDNGRLDVINHVDVESYVACVVANEVWPTFETEAYRAQAIAARTFVLFQMNRRNSAPHDVSATQGSQVYRGIRTDTPGRRAAEAVDFTHGIVLSYSDGDREHMFCAYYSAACGGMSQSAAIFGRRDAVEPLAGGVRCDYCKIAPGETYRWGPVRMKLSEVRSRLVAANGKLSALGRIRDVEVCRRTASGRPERVRLVGDKGALHEMLAERFRLALGGAKVRSTDFVISVKNDTLVFDRGRGFGHGLGMCQWGMQGQALIDRRAGEILRYYYPGSKLTRVY